MNGTCAYRRSYNAVLALALGGFIGALAAQETGSLPPPLEWTRDQDHQNMQDQLGITRLRPGPSGQNDAPNPANYDESTANRFPDWPDLLTLDNGQAVTTAEQWWTQRRPEIVAAFESEVVGRIPDNVPDVEWIVDETAEGTVAGRPVVGKHLIGRVDNSDYPLIEVEIDLTLVVPADAAGPVPVMIMFGGGNLQQLVGNAAAGGRGGFGGRGGAPGAAGAGRAGGPGGPGGPGAPAAPQDPSASDQLIAAGWGFARLNPGSIQADNGAGLTRGIIGLTNKGQARKPDDWGSLRAWSWGAARALDYFETDPLVDAARVGIEGVSRYGKAALVTLAFEERFAVGLIGSAGEGGVSPYRRDFGEMVENLTGGGEYHWMAGNFLKYGTAESSFGSMNADDLPVDSHSLIALAAPRATFISYGVPERGDALWLDQQGSYMATVAASKVFELLDVRGLGTNENYQTAVMPAVNQGLISGRLAWRQHDGGHTDGPNWKYFIPWANRELGVAEVSASTPFPRNDPNSHAAHQDLLAKTRAGKIDVYFIGDSITRRWGATDYPDLLAHWNQSFHGWNAADFAWGADRIENMLWRLNNGEMNGIEPRVVVIQGGTNNIGGRPGRPGRAEDIAAGIAALVDTVQARVPEAEIVLTGIFPRSEPAVADEIREINGRLAELAEREDIRFININDRLADKEGLMREDMATDGLHLSIAGYEVWASALRPILTEVLGPPAAVDEAPPATGDPSARG